MDTETVEFSGDLVGGYSPDEWSGIGILLGQVCVGGGLQIGDRTKDAATDALASHPGEEAFDRVEPGGGGEVEDPARIACQPSQHLGVVVGGVVVEHRVDQLAGRDVARRR